MTLVATNSVAILLKYSVKEGGYLEARISNAGKVQNTPKELPKKYYPLHMQGNGMRIPTPWWHPNKQQLKNRLPSSLTLS
jgi:hypothetical protein